LRPWTIRKVPPKPMRKGPNPIVVLWLCLPQNAGKTCRIDTALQDATPEQGTWRSSRSAQAPPCLQAGLLAASLWRSCRQRNGSGPICRTAESTEDAHAVGSGPAVDCASRHVAVSDRQRVAPAGHHHRRGPITRCMDAEFKARREYAPEMVLAMCPRESEFGPRVAKAMLGAHVA